MLNIIPWDVVFILINLIVLYVIMRIVLVKPIKSVIEKRESIIKSGLKNAAESEAKMCIRDSNDYGLRNGYTAEDRDRKQHLDI